ncbi:MAG: hypothetical protein H6772_04780 [Pseudomonadales bacterium]|nr:hypothetical protein [Pseudomonadales bacterium]
MKRLNNAFILLILILGLLTILYIWRSEKEKELLIKNITKQETQIETLINKVKQLENLNNNLDVKGASTTVTGTISGYIQLDETQEISTTIICAQDKFTTKEFCTDEIINTNDPKIFQYYLEIPKGKYFVFALPNPSAEKSFYSKMQKCSEENSEDCKNNIEILLEINENDVESDINLYL